jgi:uncharacterized protein YoxC
MDDSAEVIREQMQETRSQLSEKLETLENKVTDTVQSTSNSVSETVAAVKETVDSVTDSVQGAMHSVGDALDLGLQTDRHPWIVMGGSVALGFLAVRLLQSATKKSNGKPRRTKPRPAQPFLRTRVGERNGHKAVETPAVETGHEEASGTNKPSWFKEELSRLKGVAIGALMGVVRDMVFRNLSDGIRQPVVEEMERINRSLGGDPIRRPQTNETPTAAHHELATGQGACR